MKPMYGLTHDIDGKPRVMEPKTTKVGIGLAKGKALHAYLDQAGKWVVMVAKEQRRFETMNEARSFYRQAKSNAPDRQYPQRLPYFTFSRVSSDGTFEPDWGAIESHGQLPTEIDVVFTRDEPFTASYQMWGTTERKCDGDGLNATRILALAETKEEKALAAQAASNGEKYFPVHNGCYVKGCPYGHPNGDKPAACRPHGRLLFQLLNAPRLGGTAYFDTTGWRSISQLFSCISTFKAVTGQGDAERGFVAGIPLKMVLRPYRTKHNGKSTTQYGVALEFRADSAYDLKHRLIEHGVSFRLADAGLRQLTPASEALPIAPDDDDVPEENAAAIVAEFQAEIAHVDDDDDFVDPEVKDPVLMPRRKSEAHSDEPVMTPIMEAQTSEPDLLPWDRPDDFPTKQEAGEIISEPQAKRLFAIARKGGFSNDQIKLICASAGYKHSREILKKHYNKIVESFEIGNPEQTGQIADFLGKWTKEN